MTKDNFKNREELRKMTVKELKAYYEEISGFPYSKSIRKKDELVSVIVIRIYDIRRARAFRDYA